MNDLPHPVINCHVCGGVVPVDADGRIVGPVFEHEEGWVVCSACSPLAKPVESRPPPPKRKKRRGSATR